MRLIQSLSTNWSSKIGWATSVATLSLLSAFSSGSAQEPARAGDNLEVMRRIAGHQPAMETGQSASPLWNGNWLLVGGDAHPSRIVMVDANLQKTVSSAVLQQGRSGHTSTVLLDGSVLIYGGSSAADQILDTAEVYDPQTDSSHTLGSIGLSARAHHTATVLADGRVLFANGYGANGKSVQAAEIYDPKSRQVEKLPLDAMAQLSSPLASLLPDRSVLFWNGDSSVDAGAAGAFFNATTKKATPATVQSGLSATAPLVSKDIPAVVESVPAAHESAAAIDAPIVVRFSKRIAADSLNLETVTLLGPDGVTKIQPVAVERGVIVSVVPRRDLLPKSNYTLFFQGVKDDQGVNVPFTAIAFKTQSVGDASSEIQDLAINPGQTSLSGLLTGRLSSGHSTLSSGSSNRPVGPVSIPSFASTDVLSRLTRTLGDYGLSSEEDDADSTSPVDDSELWLPGPQHWKGDWVSRQKHLGEQHQPELEPLRHAVYGDPEIVKMSRQATPSLVARELGAKLKAARSTSKPASGVTAVSGQVLRLNGRPLPGVSISAGDRQTRTNLNGEFTLSGVPSGRQVLVIDGGATNQRPFEYGRYEYGMKVEPGKSNVLPFIIWLSRLDYKNSISIKSPSEGTTVLKNPRIPGLELRIPAGTVIRDANGKVVTRLSMTAIPTDQAPFPIPDLPVPTYFTIQPGGAHLESADGGPSAGAQLIYPNYTKSPPGTHMSFWDYDSATKDWYIYGEGTVTADGLQIMPDPGVRVYKFTGAMVSNPSNKPFPAPSPSPNPKRCGDPVDCATGLFLHERTDLSVNDVIPLQVQRSYRQLDPVSRTFGIGTNLSYDMFMVGDTQPYTYQELILADGTTIHFSRISFGTSFSDAVYRSTSTPGKFFGAILKYTGSPTAWTITLKDGTQYGFPDSDSSTNYRAAAMTLMKDRNGNTVTFTRNGYQLTQLTSPNGRHINFSYDGRSRVTAVSDDSGRQVQYAYDGSGRLATVTYPLGYTEQYTYDSNNNMLTVKDRRGNTMVTNTYDANNRVSKQTYADNSTMSFAYTLDSNSKVTQTDVTNQRGVVNRTLFNSNGYVISDTVAQGLSQQQTKTITVDSTTNLTTKVVDALNRTWTYAYDALGNVNKIMRPDGSSISYSYDSQYNLISQYTDANGNTSQVSRDGLGNPTQITDPISDSIRLTFDEQGRPITVTDGVNNTSSITYFGADPSGITNANAERSFFSFDQVGRPAGFTDGLGNASSMTFDALDRTTSMTDANGSLVQMSYDGNGNRLTETDANNHTRTYGYDSLDRMTSVVDALGGQETRSYDAAGNLVGRIDRNGQIRTYAYDALDRRTSVTYQHTERYNPHQVQCNPHQETYVSDPGLLPNSGLPPPVGPTYSTRTVYDTCTVYDTRTVDDSNVAYTYDAGNRVTQISDSANGTITRGYDALNRLTQETTPQGTVGYSYDAGGRRTKLSASNAPDITYTYDNANRLTQIQQAAGTINGNAAQTVTFGYDAANRRTSLKLPNGVTASYGYDVASRLTSLVYKKADNSVLGDLTYSYDAAGRRTGIGGSLATVLLPNATSYDAVYDANNRETAYNGTTQSYDANGNLTSDGQNTFTWNGRDQFIALSGGATVSNAYDGMGRRRQTTIGGTSTSYLYDGQNITQKNQTGTQYSYLTGGIDEVFGQYAGSTNKSFPITDASQSTVAETDVSGSPISISSYEPYGKTSTTGTDTKYSQRYTGREADLSGLYYYRARYYSPVMQRFISEDPIGWGSGQQNNYAYVNGRPTRAIDPLGLLAIYIGGTGGITGGGLAGSAGGGFVFDLNGNFGTYSVTGVGGGAGGDASFGLSVGFLTATSPLAPDATINDFGGPFAQGSAGFGLGAYAGIDAFTDPDNPYAGGGITVGEGVGGGFSIQATNTVVTPISLLDLLSSSLGFCKHK